MKPEKASVFMYSAGALFSITAMAKIVSSFGSSSALQLTDPIIGLSFQHLFWIVASVELLVAGVCLFAKKETLKAGMVAWLSTGFLIYRFGLFWAGYHKPCSCMGTLTDSLHIPPKIADDLMKVILIYLLFGSYVILFQSWRRNVKNPAALSPLGPAN